MAETKKATTKKVAAVSSSDKPMIRVTQIHSGAGRSQAQNGTLKGLGLGKQRRTRVLEDTPAVRGMVAAVQHLVTMEEVK